MEKIKKTDDEWKKELTDEQFQCRAQEGHGAGVHRRVLGQSRERHVSLRLLR